ncbi:MAG TPA: phosphoribosyltransferase family protein [Candidatus Binataceae bacterium]|nr:phosphoribosyltransferase family protein [Candidatus Binataceae bacterium]
MRQEMWTVFADRAEAGRRLGTALHTYRELKPVVLSVPRGGVPVGYEVALALNAPLDVIVVHRLTAPLRPELGIGALADGDQVGSVFSEAAICELRLPREFLAREVELELREIRRRQQVYRREHRAIGCAGHTVIVVDDGIASGASVTAALRAVRRAGAARAVLAVPVAPSATLGQLRREVDEVVCLVTPEECSTIGRFYSDFSAVSDRQVINLLDLARVASGWEIDGADAREALSVHAR